MAVFFPIRSSLSNTYAEIIQITICNTTQLFISRNYVLFCPFLGFFLDSDLNSDFLRVWESACAVASVGKLEVELETVGCCYALPAPSQWRPLPHIWWRCLNETLGSSIRVLLHLMNWVAFSQKFLFRARCQIQWRMNWQLCHFMMFISSEL